MRGYGLKKAYVFKDQSILTARDRVYVVNLKLIARCNWRNLGVIGDEIVRKKGEN